MSSITIATSYAADGLLYLSSGYVGDKLKVLYAIKPGASGDITPPAGETSGEFLAWSNPGIETPEPDTRVGGCGHIFHHSFITISARGTV